MAGKFLCLKYIFHRYACVSSQKLMKLFWVWPILSNILCATDSKLGVKFFFMFVMVYIAIT